MRKLLTAFLLQGFERTPYNFCKLRLGSASKMSSGEAVPTTVRKDAENDAVKRRLEGDVSQEPAVKLHKSEDSATGSTTATTEKKVKYPKKKVAVLLSYCGVGYQGMQINPGTRTIEKDLLNAFYKTGCVPEGCTIGKMKFQRCARTDKGVSAAGQVVSLRLLLLDNLVEKLNEHLPSVIRVMDIKRTTGSFNSKHHCNYRTYMYLLPTYSFQDVEEVTTEKYRITDEKLQEVNDLLAKYKGTHNFHNFTSGKLHDDMSANRYIMDFVCEKAFVDEGMEFAIMRVKGQSFMLHQIRKMIGLVIAIVRGYASKSTLERAFESKKLDIPRAPGLGLVLESVHYDWYNKKWSGDGVHDSLSWEDSKDKQEEFKRKHIYPNIIVREKYNKSMMHWLGTLPLHSYDVVEAHNPMRSFLAAAKSDDKITTNPNEIPPDVDLATLRPGQTPEEFLKSLPTSETITEVAMDTPQGSTSSHEFAQIDFTRKEEGTISGEVTLSEGVPHQETKMAKDDCLDGSSSNKDEMKEETVRAEEVKT